MNFELVNKLTAAGIDKNEAIREISILKKEISDPLKILNIIEERVRTRKPLQYILGKAYFMDFEVKVNEKVLIPRPETEILIEEAVKRLSNDPNRRSVACYAPTTLLDIGTGSGIIPIALCKMIPNIEVIAIDINKEIIDLAYENAKNNDVKEKIKFQVCDIFSSAAEELFKKHKFDLVISNPPYIFEGGLDKLSPEVRYHEPKPALTGSKLNKTGLIYYERILELVKKYLNVGRHCEEQSDEAISKTFEGLPRHPLEGVPRNDTVLLALEIDPPLIDNLKNLLKREGLNNFEIIKDYAKLDRCLCVYIP